MLSAIFHAAWMARRLTDAVERMPRMNTGGKEVVHTLDGLLPADDGRLAIVNRMEIHRLAPGGAGARRGGPISRRCLEAEVPGGGSGS